MEDIVADDVVISDEEVIRTDAVTGAETRLHPLPGPHAARADHGRRRPWPASIRDGADLRGQQQVRPRRPGRPGPDHDQRRRPADPGRAPDPPGEALDRLAEGVRGVGLGGRRRGRLARGLGRRRWPRPIPGSSRDLVLVSGLLLPIWSQPAGQGDLGPPAEGAGRPALAGPRARSRPGPAAEDRARPLRHRQRRRRRRRGRRRWSCRRAPPCRLAGGLWLRRAKVMDRYRIEVVGAASQRSALHGARLLRRDHRLHAAGVRADRPAGGADGDPGQVAGADDPAEGGVRPAGRRRLAGGSFSAAKPRGRGRRKGPERASRPGNGSRPRVRKPSDASLHPAPQGRSLPLGPDRRRHAARPGRRRRHHALPRRHLGLAPRPGETIPEPLRETAYSGGGWFEEDCDWCIPYLALGLHRFEADRERARSEPGGGAEDPLARPSRSRRPVGLGRAAPMLGTAAHG